jgi:acetylornithine deacetylase/succinyl-diaminopimelate desuccinylase-like protein
MDVIELTKKLISIESTMGNEHEISEFIASYLDFADVELQEVEGFGPNVIATDIKSPEKPLIILNCHMDTVEVAQGWTHDPFTPQIQENKMFGLGSCDMKAGCAVAMDVFKKISSSDMNIIFTAVSDEEGNSTGSHVLLKKLKNDLKEGLRSGLCLIPEDTEETIKLGARGRYVVEITVTGKSAHGAMPEYGVSAIEDAAKIVNAIPNLGARSHPKLGQGSLCVLKINGGGDSLSVPDTCIIRVDRHTVIGEDKDQIRKDFEGLIKDLDLKCSCNVSWMTRKTPFLEPYFLDEDNTYASQFIESYKEFYKKLPDIGYGKSVGDFNAFGKLMPTIVFGPGGERPHGPDECVYIDSITRCRDLYLEFLRKLARN